MYTWGTGKGSLKEERTDVVHLVRTLASTLGVEGIVEAGVVQGRDLRLLPSSKRNETDREHEHTGLRSTVTSSRGVQRGSTVRSALQQRGSDALLHVTQVTP